MAEAPLFPYPDFFTRADRELARIVDHHVSLIFLKEQEKLCSLKAFLIKKCSSEMETLIMELKSRLRFD